MTLTQKQNQNPADSSDSSRDERQNATGRTTGNPRKKRKRAPQSPGLSGFDGVAWPSLATNKDCCGLLPSQAKSWPRFVVVEAENPEEPLSKLSPWALQKCFQGISTSIVNIKRMAKTPGAYLVECPSEKAAGLLLARNKTLFVDRNVKITPHRSLNTCKGVIIDRSGQDINLEHLEEGLKDQGVTNVHRVSRVTDGKKFPTNTYFLTFGMPNPPAKIRIPTVGTFDVRVFVPRPLQCYNCWRFGHPQSKCQADRVCKLCGSKAHEGSCPNPAKCGNCKGPHGPGERSCPSYKKEATIQRIRAERGISFGEARKEVEATIPKNGQSFADAAASAIGQQTPASNLKNHITPQPRRDPLKVQSSCVQFGVDLPDAVRFEALALGKGLAEELRAKRRKTPTTKDASAQFAAEAPNTKGKQTKSATKAAKAAKQTNKSAKQVPKPANTTSQAKPGGASAPAPKASEAKQAKGPAPPKTPITETAPASAPQAAAGGSSGTGTLPDKIWPEAGGKTPTPTPAHQAVGEKTTTTPTRKTGGASGSALKAPAVSFGDGVEVPTSGGFTFGFPLERRRVRSPIKFPKEKPVLTSNTFDPLSSLSEGDPTPPLYPFEKEAAEGGIFHNPIFK